MLTSTTLKSECHHKEDTSPLASKKTKRRKPIAFQSALLKSKSFVHVQNDTSKQKMSSKRTRPGFPVIDILP